MLYNFTMFKGISAIWRSALALLAPLSLIPLLCVSALGQTYDMHAWAEEFSAGAQRMTQTPSVATASDSLALAGSMAQIASAGGWDTSLTVVNLGTTSGEALLNFYANNGSALSLPFTFPQQSSGTTTMATVDQTLNANATLVLDTTGPASQAAAAGSSQLLTSGNVAGFAIFKYTPSGQEAVVPLETRNASSYVLAFDNTGQIGTGLAIANLATNSANIGVIIRDDSGAQIGTGSISLAAEGHNSFMLTDASQGFPITAGKRGTVEFDTPSGGRISALGLRANGAALTSLPLLANVGTAGGAMAHVASGGGWQTTFTLVNTGTTSANATLSFVGDNGSALSLPLSFPQTGAKATESSLSQSIAAGAMLVIVTQGLNSASSATGSAWLSTTGNVSGFAIFQNAGQEAVVPLETGSASSYTLAFDNTSSLATGVALANGSTQSASIPATLRDSTGAVLGTTTIPLSASGHSSWMLTGLFPAAANIRGTVEFDTPSGGQISALGIRATPAGAYTTIPVMTVAASGNLTAERALAQNGLAIGLASNVLQTQMGVLLTSTTAGSPCQAMVGNGSIASGSTPTTVGDEHSYYPVTIYYDNYCTKTYMMAKVTSAKNTGGETGVLSETVAYYGLGGTTLGTMTLNETLSEANDDVQVDGLGLFTPAGSQTPVQLGLSCDVSLSGSSSIPCTGAVLQNFPALNLAIGSVTSTTLNGAMSGGSLTFTGSGSILTGPIGSLTLTSPSLSSFAIPSGTAYASTTASGGAGAFALFPPTPTSWTLTDAAHDEKVQVSVTDNTTHDSSLTVTQTSTGTTLATGTIDQSGTGTITYSDGSKAAITNWTLAN